MTTNRQTLLYCVLLAAGLLATAACTEDLTAGGGSRQRGERIRFTAEDENATRAATADGLSETAPVAFEGTLPGRPLVLTATVQAGSTPGGTTRGVRLEGVSDLGTFGVSASKTALVPNVEQMASAKNDFFYNLPATRNADGVFEISQDYYWPADDERLNFYAYAPYGEDSGVELSDRDAAGPQRLTYTVSGDVAAQKDLVTATTSSSAFSAVSGDAKKSSVPLAFNHELTAIRFVIGEQWLAGSIKSVAIRNVHGKGTMTIGTHEWEWTDKAGNSLTATDDFELLLDRTGLSGTDGEEFIDDASLYFLMLPQEFDDESSAVLEVKYQDMNREYTVRAPLKGTAWTRNSTVNYAIGSHALTTLKIGTISWPDESASGAWSGPKTGFASGDAVGLYVVDGADNKTILHQNVQCTFDGTAWTVHHPEGNPVYKLPGRQYFFYYPYTSTPDTKYPLLGQGTENTEATAFFSHLIDGWTPAAMQDNEDVFLLQDLQVARGTDHPTTASTVNAVMAHQMNIAAITLGSKNIPEYGYNRSIYRLSTDANYTWVHSCSDLTVINSNYNIQASSTFGGGTRPFKSGDVYYYVFKPVTDPATEAGSSISALQADNVTSDWTETFKVTTRGNLVARTAQSSRTRYDSNRYADTYSNYTLALGDAYYSNGAISHSLITTASNSYYTTPIAVVGYIGSDAISENRHALALSLYKMGCRFQYETSTPEALPDNLFPGVDSKTGQMTDYKGYEKTQYLKNNKSNWNVVTALANYSTSQPAPSVSTGWFIPASGQILAIFRTLGGVTYEEQSTHFESWYDTDDTGPNNINTAIGKIVDLNSNSQIGPRSGFWTSSENSVGNGMLVFHQYLEDSGTIMNVHLKSAMNHLRPVLAF